MPQLPNTGTFSPRAKATRVTNLEVVELLKSQGIAMLPSPLPPQLYVNMPAAASGTPSIQQCQALVQALANRLAALTVANSTALQAVYRATTANQAGATGVIAGVASGALAALTSVTESVPVDIVLNNPWLLQDLALRLAVQSARVIDYDLLNMYPLYNTNGTVGSPQTALTKAVLDSILTTLPASPLGEPPILILHPAAVAGLVTLATDNSAAIDRGVADLVAGLYGNGRYALYKNLRVMVSGEVPISGSSPTTTHNLALYPSALGFLSSIQSPATNDGTHAQTTSTALGFSTLVSITNTGSGNQTVTVTTVKGTVLLVNARGLQVNS